MTAMDKHYGEINRESWNSRTDADSGFGVL